MRKIRKKEKNNCFYKEKSSKKGFGKNPQMKIW